MTAKTTSRRPEGYIVAAIVLSPLVVRAMLITEHDLRVRAGDLRGLASAFEIEHELRRREIHRQRHRDARLGVVAP